MIDSKQKSGIEGSSAPELQVEDWLDGFGDIGAPLKLADHANQPALLYFFQSWCAGCHSHGFPTLAKVVDELEDEPVLFAAIQTVFEGHSTNTLMKAQEVQQKLQLGIPFGHDEGHPPQTMRDYRSGGTPWFVVIGANGEVLANRFHLDPDAAIRTLRSQLASAGTKAS